MAFPLFLSCCALTQAILVIPGCAAWRRPGIHTPDRGYGFRARSFHSRPGMTSQSFLSGHLLRGPPDHVPARLFVERLLFEFADRKPRLDLRSRAHLGIPALDVGIIVERKALRLVGHGPGKAGDVGNRIVARDVTPRFAQLRIEHTIKPGRLVMIALDGIGDFLRRVEREMTVLAEHGTKPAHLPHHPLYYPLAAPHALRQTPPGLA